MKAIVQKVLLFYKRVLYIIAIFIVIILQQSNLFILKQFVLKSTGTSSGEDQTKHFWQEYFCLDWLFCLKNKLFLLKYGEFSSSVLAKTKLKIFDKNIFAYDWLFCLKNKLF